MMNAICIGLLCLSLQAPGTQPETQKVLVRTTGDAELALDNQKSLVRTVADAELVMEIYAPTYLNARELQHLASDMAGSKFLAVDADERQRPMRSMRSFEETVLIYDTAKRVQTLRTLLEKLDAVAAMESAKRLARDAAGQAHEQQASHRETTRHYRPQFLSLSDLSQALMPYRIRYDRGFDFVEDAGFMVFTVPDGVAEEVLGFLKQVDVPAPQLEITCYLVRGVNVPAETPAPAELTAGLRELIGYEHLEVRAHSMLRTSASAEHLSLRLDVDGPPHYELEMRPAAYTDEDGALTLAECVLLRGHTGVDGMTRVFSTETTIYAGEYTVIGATGAAPELVVIRCRRAGGAVRDGKPAKATAH